MLLKFTIENFEVFQKPVELSMEANLHTRKFLSTSYRAVKETH